MLGKPVPIVGVAAAIAITWVTVSSMPPHSALIGSIVALCTLGGILIVLRIIRGPLEGPGATTDLPPIPTAPTKRVARGLTIGEMLLWESREHPLSLWLWWFGAAALQPATIAIATTNWEYATLIWLVGMAALGGRIFIWDRNRMCITNKRLFAVSGILNITYRTMPLARMTDQTAQFPALSNILAWLRIIKTQYVTLVVESAGQDQALSKIYCVPEGHKVNRLIMSLVLKAP